MRLLGERGKSLGRELLLRQVVRAGEPRTERQVEADGRGLGDDHDAVPVREIQHLLRIRIVRGAEGVRAHPLHEGEVVHHQRIVMTLATDGGVLVLAEACEVEGLAVDEQLRALDLDRANADRQRVAVRAR